MSVPAAVATTDHVRDYLAHGLVLVPIPAGRKGPSRRNWNKIEYCLTDPAQAPAVTGNVGLAHAYSRTCTVDVDDYAAAVPWLLERGLDLDAMLTDDAAVQISSGRQNRAKLLYRLPEGVDPLATVQPPGSGLELRCASRDGLTVQDVLPPSTHPGTGRPYTWTGLGDWRELPELPPSLLTLWRGLLAPALVATAQGAEAHVSPQTVSELRSALNSIPADAYDVWVRTGCALSELGTAGRELWLTWSQTSDKWRPEDAAKWATFRADKTGYQAVFAEAQRCGWVNPMSAAAQPAQQAPEPEPELPAWVVSRVGSPRPNWSAERVRGALGFLDPAESFGTVLRAVHFSSGGTDEGLDLILDWLQPETEEQRDGVIEKWGTGLDPGKKKPITILSVFREARAAGWDGRPAPQPRDLNLSVWTAARFQGAAAPRQWLVEGVFPQGIPAMVAAMGEVGKSMLLLRLALAIVGPQRLAPEYLFGGAVLARGSVVILTAEDDSREIHERLNNLDPSGWRMRHPHQLVVVPLPDAGGPMTLVSDAHGQPVATAEFNSLLGKLKEIDDLKLVVIDPLQAFVGVDVNADPAAGQFVCHLVGRVAAETGATVILTHHARKNSRPIETPADARDAIRGTTALVDGVRCAYVLWPAADDKARRICRDLDVSLEPNRVVQGCVVKANFRANRRSITYVRDETGLLVDQTLALTPTDSSREILVALADVISQAAIAGQPYTKTGVNGVYQRRTELPEILSCLARQRLEDLVQTLLDRGEAVQCLAQGSTTVKWLDTPDGPFALGIARHKPGATHPPERSRERGGNGREAGKHLPAFPPSRRER